MVAMAAYFALVFSHMGTMRAMPTFFVMDCVSYQQKSTLIKLVGQ